jgi:hypothetical protein
VGPGPDDDELRDRLVTASGLEVARFYVSQQINDHLQDVHPTVLPFRGGEVRLVPKSLVAAIYYRFAQDLRPTKAGHLPSRPCAGCGESLLPQRRNQKYHDERCRKNAWYQRHAG